MKESEPEARRNPQKKIATADGGTGAAAVAFERVSARDIDVHVGDRIYHLHDDPIGTLHAVVEATLPLFATLGTVLTGLYTSFMKLRLDLLDYTTGRPDVEQYLSDPLPDHLRRDVKSVMARLDQMSGALGAIHASEFARSCWQRSATVSRAENLLSISRTLREHGFSEAETAIPISSIASLQPFIDVAIGKLEEDSFAHIVTAVIATNSADIESVGKGYDHAALRTLVFGGNLLFAMLKPCPLHSGSLLVASFGTAMLADIYLCIPDRHIVQAALAERFPRYRADIDKLDVRMSREEVVGHDLAAALAELKKRDLFILEVRQGASR